MALADAQTKIELKLLPDKQWPKVKFLRSGLSGKLGGATTSYDPTRMILEITGRDLTIERVRPVFQETGLDDFFSWDDATSATVAGISTHAEFKGAHA